MKKRIAKLLSGLRSGTGGNAALIVALGMPVLIGGTGFAVDTAQWYAWKQEMQFAADQAAISAAWAQTNDITRANYVDRGDQEYTANLSLTTDFADDPVIALADYAGGDDNSVVITATATAKLPFSSFLTGDATTIRVTSQAQFEEGASYTSCVIATDPDDDGAITISGNATLTAGCGMAALSDSESAIVVNGNPRIDAGYILSAGGIDQDLADLGDNTLLEYMSGLYDPWEGLTPPNNPTPRSLSCEKNGGGGSTSASWTANESQSTQTSYSYYQGSNANNAAAISYSPVRQGSSSSADLGQQSYSSQPVNSSKTTTTWSKLTGNGKNTIWEVRNSTVTTTYTNVQQAGGDGPVANSGNTALPGSYSGFKVQCDTVMQSGVYVIDGGLIDINAQDSLSGSGIMFVLKNGAGIKINGGSNINLTAMTVSELITAGVSAADAQKLEGMLIFEDPQSEGNGKGKGNIINGNAGTILNGIVYLPKSDISFRGTAGVTSRCFMLAAKTIDIGGTADMTSFCPAGEESNSVVANTKARVRLVA